MGCATSQPKDPGVGQQAGGGGFDDAADDYQPLSQEEVNARIQCCDKTQHFTLGKTGIKLRYAYLSQRGYYPEDLYKANQDAFKIVPNFGGDKSRLFFGVFDGHGQDGDHCSYFVRDNIEAHLKSALKRNPHDFERAYKDAFINLNLAMHETVRANSAARSVPRAVLWGGDAWIGRGGEGGGGSAPDARAGAIRRISTTR